jgi:hypothetical protein
VSLRAAAGDGFRVAAGSTGRALSVAQRSQRPGVKIFGSSQRRHAAPSLNFRNSIAFSVPAGNFFCNATKLAQEVVDA